MRALCLLSILLAAGCYHPQIADGAFACGPANSCPEGFSCGLDQRCHQGGSVNLGVDLPASGAFVGSGALGPLDLTSLGNGLVCANTDDGTMFFLQTGVADGGSIDCSTTAGRMTLVSAKANGFSNLAQPSGGPRVGLWNFSKVVIPAGVKIAPATSDKSALVIASTGELTLGGTISFSLYGGTRGGAGQAGGTRNSGAASGGGGAVNDSNGAGGGGGGYHNQGGNGNGPSGSAGMGGASYGSPTLVPLHMGSGGGGGGFALPDGGGQSPAGLGGFSGSAVALFGADVTITGTIDVTGSDGQDAATGPAGGGGGGSGGSILVSGVNVTLDSGHDLLAAGGKGGMGAAGGSAGGDRSPGRIWIGGTHVNMTTIHSDTPAVLGGNGSAVTTFPR